MTDLQQAIDRYLSSHGYDRIDPRAALLDMDGTLYDSMPHHADAWKQMADAASKIEADRDEFFMYEGRTGASTINILFNRQYGRNATDDEIKDLYAKKSANFKAMPPVSPMPGAASVLHTLMDAGIERVLVTGSGQRSLIDRLDRDFPGAFSADKMITAFNTKHGKPHPDPYTRAMAMAGAEPWQSIAFENAPLGVESASRSGAFTIGLSPPGLYRCRHWPRPGHRLYLETCHNALKCSQNCYT